MDQIFVAIDGQQAPVIVETGTLGLGQKLLQDIQTDAGIATDAAEAAQAAAQEAEEALEGIGTAIAGKADTDASNIIAGVWRDALGLRDSATQDVGAGAGTVAAGNDARLGFTRAQLAARSIPSVIQSLTTSGYSADGDGGGALYVRVASEPTHAGKFQSADGAWWELNEAAVSPAMFGGSRFTGPIDNTANGFRGTSRTQFTDALPAFEGARDYVAYRRGVGKVAYVDVDGYYYLGGELAIDADDVSLIGRGRYQSGVRIAGFSAQTPGVHVQALGFVAKSMEVCNDDRGGSDPGDTGHTGTCFTTGDFLRLGVHMPSSADLDDLLLTRAVGARVSHALAFMGNTRGVSLGLGSGVEIDGTLGARHQMGILVHWGAQTVGIGQPITESYHPSTIIGRNLVMRGCDSLGFVSSPCTVDIADVEGYDVAGGWSVSAGDEADAYAQPADQGRVMSRIRLTDVTLRGLTGRAFSLVGRSTSKVDRDQINDYLYRMIQFGPICLDRWDVVCVDGSTDHHAYLDFSRVASFSMDGWRTRGATTTGYSVGAQRCRGGYAVTNGDFYGAFSGTDICDFVFDGSTFTTPAVNGMPSIATGTFAFRATGRTFNKTLAAGASAGATSLELSAGGFSVHVGPGDPIITPGGIVYATDIIRSGCTTIPVTPLPAAVSIGATVTLDNLSRNLKGDMTLTGGEYGLVTDGVEGLALGGKVKDFGTFGHYPKNTKGICSGIVFENGGLGRIANAGLTVANVMHGAGSDMLYLACEYGRNAPYCHTGVHSEAAAKGGRHISCSWRSYNDAINMATPTYGRIEFIGCVDAATGARLEANAAQAWTPVLKVGTTTPAQTVAGAFYSLLDPDNVRVEAIITIDTASGTGNLTIEGLPYPTTGTTVDICRPASAVGLTGVTTVRNSGSTFLLEQASATGAAAITQANIQNGTQFRFSAVYRRT